MAIEFRGDLQAEVMQALWTLGQGSVEEVRAKIPQSRGAAYNTVQTVLNRLAARGLLERERRGNAFLYRPVYQEADYLAQTIGDRLASATPPARQAALTGLVEGLDSSDLDEIVRYAQRVRRARDRT